MTRQDTRELFLTPYPSACLGLDLQEADSLYYYSYFSLTDTAV